MAYEIRFNFRQHYSHSPLGIEIPVVLEAGGRKDRTLAKVDTGASFCIFKREHGEALGLDLTTGVPEQVHVATGDSFLTYGHTVSLHALGCALDVIIYFADDIRVRRNVLGRRGWLDVIRLGIIDYDRVLYASRYNEV